MKLYDYLYFETDDSCALCGSKGIDSLTVHHIDSNPQNSVYDNMIVLCHNCHCRYHQNKGISEDDIKNRKRHLIEKIITQYGLNALKISYRNNFGVVSIPFLLHHMVDMGLMKQEEVQMKYGNVDATARFSLTDKGRKMYEDWFK